MISQLGKLIYKKLNLIIFFKYTECVFVCFVYLFVLHFVNKMYHTVLPVTFVRGKEKKEKLNLIYKATQQAENNFKCKIWTEKGKEIPHKEKEFLLWNENWHL